MQQEDLVAANSLFLREVARLYVPSESNRMSPPGSVVKAQERIAQDGLLYVEGFADLVAADKAFGRAELLEQAQKLAVLEYPRVDSNGRRGD